MSAHLGIAIAYTFIRGRKLSACALSYVSLRFVRV